MTALIVTLLVEGFNQGTPARMIDYLIHRPVNFACNFLIVLTTLSVSELLRCRIAVLGLLSFAWFAFGVANYICCRERSNPLLMGDLIVTREIFELITVYFTWPQIILMCVGAMALIVGVIMLFTRTALRPHVDYGFGVGFVAGCAVLTWCVTLLATQSGHLPRTLTDRVYAYRDYGFSTCFTRDFGVLGVARPEDYSNETVEEILDEIDEEPASPIFGESDDLQRPNLVFVQLESFFDVSMINGASFSRDPIPNFHMLTQTCPTGALRVPTVGGGTANVEFEMMAGMNMDFFGAGETPYITIISQKTCETAAHVLKRQGYAATALHNNTGTFYSRNSVYANLGFDHFIPLEYMPDPTYTETGWARDEILARLIPDVMKSTEERDLIFAISVESHGKYPDEYEPKPLDIEVLSLPEGVPEAPFCNYVNIISDVDAFIGTLLDKLNTCGEPTVAVFYGDHLPGLGLESDMLSSGDLYTSRYVIWNNYGTDFEAPDLQAYRLNAEILRQLGVHDGVMARFHQSYPLGESEDYLEKLRTLEYDLLYGEQDAYGEAGAPEPSELQLGLVPIRIENVETAYGRMLVTGSGFTPASKVFADEIQMETVYINGTTLASLPTGNETPPVSICVAQISPDGQELGRTEPFPLK